MGHVSIETLIVIKKNVAILRVSVCKRHYSYYYKKQHNRQYKIPISLILLIIKYQSL